LPSTATPSPPLNYSTVASLPNPDHQSDSPGINYKETDGRGDYYCDNDDDGDDDDNNDDDDYHCNLI